MATLVDKPGLEEGIDELALALMSNYFSSDIVQMLGADVNRERAEPYSRGEATGRRRPRQSAEAHRE